MKIEISADDWVPASRPASRASVPRVVTKTIDPKLERRIAKATMRVHRAYEAYQRALGALAALSDPRPKPATYGPNASIPCLEEVMTRDTKRLTKPTTRRSKL